MRVDKPSPFGDLLRRHRQAAGLTQEDLAEQAQMSVRGISALENGERLTPRRDTIRVLAQVLRLSERERGELEVAARGRESSSHTPDTPPDQSHSLPATLTSFVGRERELAEVRRLLASARLVTLTGPGGTGKTRLARQISEELRSEYADGVIFVSLAPIRDPELVASTIAQELGVKETAGRLPREMLQEYLRHRRLLLVLDNFEQVVEAGPLIVDLLTDCAELRVIVTSRTVLHVSGEHSWSVPPMLLPDAKLQHTPQQLSQYESVALFIERARAVKSDFTLTETNAIAVAQICSRLDGLPLAIELAAARSRLLSPQAMLARLLPRLQFLKGGAHDLPQRQRTLRDAIDWSYSLLSEDEQRLFIRLSVFMRGRTLEAIEAVCNPEGEVDVLTSLESLLEKSLLRQEEAPDGEPRFVMLETIHEYAREHLEASAEAEELRRRHAEYFLALAEEAEPELRGSQQCTWLPRLEEEHDNLRAALGWSLESGNTRTAVRLGWALGMFWWIHGHLSEGRRWMEDALARGEALPEHMRAKALVIAGCMAFGQGDYEQSESRCEESLALLRTEGDKRVEALALGILGLTALHQADYERATALFEESLELFQQLADKWGCALLIGGLGVISLYRGDYEQATALLEDSLTLSRQIGDRPSTYGALYNLALVAQFFGDYVRASRLFREGLALSMEVGDKANIAYCIEGLAGVASVGGQAASAARMFGSAEALLQAIGNPVYDVDRSLYEAMVTTTRGQLDEHEFTRAWAEGRALTPEQAITEALRESDPT